MSELVIKIDGKGFTHLQYRFGASLVRSRIEDQFNMVERIVLDFVDIQTISISYADEIYAKLLLKFEFDKIREKVKFENTSNIIKSIIAQALGERIRSQQNDLQEVEE